VAFCRGDRSGQKFLDCVTDLLVDKKEMIISRQLEQSCSRKCAARKRPCSTLMSVSPVQWMTRVGT
jgi:hypothetical protein